MSHVGAQNADHATFRGNCEQPQRTRLGDITHQQHNNVRHVGPTVGACPNAAPAPTSCSSSPTQMRGVGAPQLSLHTAAQPPAPVARHVAARPVQLPRAARAAVEDIDAKDGDDIMAVAEYVQDIHANLRAAEGAKHPSAAYMDKQPHINAKMRAILIDWLVEVHLKFKLVPETLYLTVNLIDRFLERAQVARSKLQLVGVTALLLASKYEEIYPPEIRDLVYITDRAYSKTDILCMESTILNKLEFNLTVPSVGVFLARYLKAAHADDKMHHMAHFIAERTLQELRFVKFAPSMLGAACVLVARRALHVQPTWTRTLEHYTQYAERTLEPCVRELMELMAECREGNLQAVRKKYSSSKFGSVAGIPMRGV